MRRVALSAFALVCGHSAIHAAWFTLAGNPLDNSADYIQVDPQSVVADGVLRTLQVRVSRAQTRTSTDGVAFRSFQGIAEVNCEKKTARYTSATFYNQPHFTGPPVTTLTYQPNQVRPVAFRQIDGDYAQRLIRAACVVEKTGG
ncbi:MAG: hypothetical protein EOP81_14940 [Variovorax sp.]|nr:MAG: hypothetical protein EOP81_14940 [Variovorax sp.]